MSLHTHRTDQSPLVQHVARELDILLTNPEDSVITGGQADAIVDLAIEFTGHSGGSAPFSIGALAWAVQTALSYEPLSPLTGQAQEWMVIDEDMMGRPGVEQNVRCGRVFRENGQVYAIDSVVWTEVYWRRPEGRRLPRPTIVGFTRQPQSARAFELPGFPPKPRRVWKRLMWPAQAWARLTGTAVR